MSDDPDKPDYRVYRVGGATPAGRRRNSEADAGADRPRTPPPDGREPEAPARRPDSGAPRRDAPARRPDPGAARRDPPARRPGSGAPGGPRPEPDPDYTVYRSQPRGVLARLRGESDSDIGRRIEESERAGATRREAGQARAGRRGLRRSSARPLTGSGLGRWARGTWTWRRALKYVVSAIVGWVVLSIVLFFVSAETKAGNLPPGLKQALTPASGPMLFSAANVLVLGLDNRPTSGVGSHEPGSNYNELDANTDSIMIWRVGGGVSRRLSIPRDTQVNLGGSLGEEKINAAWSQAGGGSPALTVKAVENLTGITINHVIVVDLANFPNFINDVGGVTVHNTVRICSNLAGGAADGGYSLFLNPGTHHLNGTQALTYARTRDDGYTDAAGAFISCDPAYTDLQREAAQQQILNSIKSQLFSFHAFINLPWVSWDAPGVVQTDMGPLTLLQLFASSEIGGSPKPLLLSETSETDELGDVLIPNPANIRTQVNKLING